MIQNGFTKPIVVGGVELIAHKQSKELINPPDEFGYKWTYFHWQLQLQNKANKRQEHLQCWGTPASGLDGISPPHP